MNIQHLTRGALLLAMGIILPQVFHLFGWTGPVFLPMHIPVLLAGILVGPWTGLAVGLFSPIASHLITGGGMPPMAPLPMLVFMSFELPVMGLAVGILYRKIKLNIILSLVAAMVVGRAAVGLVIMAMTGFFSYQLPPAWVFVSGAIVTGLPGIVIQMVLIPILALRTERRSSRWGETLR